MSAQEKIDNLINWSDMARVWGAYEMMGISPLNLRQMIDYLESPICIVGAGSGLNVEYLAADGYEVVGLDNNRSMIELAKRQRKVDIVYGSADDLPFDDSSYKTVILATGLFNQVTLYQTFAEKILSEAGRIVTPGGNVVLGYFTEASKLNYVFDHLKLTNVPSNNRLFVNKASLEEVKLEFEAQTDINPRLLDYIFDEYSDILEDQLALVSDVCSYLTDGAKEFVADNLGFAYYDLNHIDENYLKELFCSRFSLLENKKVEPGDVSVLIGMSQ